jgi:drug/metabolite transporter (DMT)-like permease
LTSGYIVGVPLLGWLVYRNQTRVVEVVGVLTAVTGMGLLSMQGGKLTIERGDALTLGCAAVYAVHIVLLGHLAPRIPYETLSFLQVAAAAGFAWIALPFVETPAIRWTPAVILAIVAGGLLATALAFVLQTWAQQYTTPTRAALIFALEPVFAWFGAWWWNGEILTGRAAAGAALILAGVLLVELKPNRKTAHP